MRKKLFMVAFGVMAGIADAHLPINGSIELSDPITITGDDFPSFDITGWRAFATPELRDGSVTLELVDDPAEATDGGQYIRMISTVSGAGDFGLNIHDPAYRPVLTQGETYTFSFDARHVAGPENALQVVVREVGPTNVDHVNEWFELSGGWESYTYTVTAVYDQSSLDIAFRPKAGGGSTMREQTLHLDNVQVRVKPSSVLIERMEMDEYAVRLTVCGEDRVNYSLYSATNLTDSPIEWQLLDSVQGGGFSMQMAARATTDPARFFRVDSVPASGGTMVSAVKYPSDDLPLRMHSVTSYGADPTGVEDSTVAFEAAMEACAVQGGGTVFAPIGQYRIDGTLEIPPGVTLRGDWRSPHDSSSTGIGTLLKAYAGRGDAEGTPFITLRPISGVKNVAIWYPEQTVDQIVPYPWTIKQTGGQGMTVENVTLFNAYQGIQIGPEVNELHVLRHVYGTPLRYGLFRDRTTDVGRNHHLYFSPDYWVQSGLPGAPESEAEQAMLREWMLANGEAIVIHFPNWVWMYDVFLDGYRTGISTRPSIAVEGRLGPNGGVYDLTITNSLTGIELGRNNEHGFQVTHGDIHVVDEAGAAAVHATSEFTSLALFNSVTVSGRVFSEGTGLLSFINSEFIEWPGNQSAIDMQRGGISVLQSIFRQNDRHVYLGSNVRGALIAGNSFPQQLDIEDRTPSGVDVEITHQALGLPEVDTTYQYLVPERRPESRLLYDAADYGARGNAVDDDAPAIQAALDAAGHTGGTVYLPPGQYLMKGEVLVPSGVELRGSFDTQHHTQFGGTHSGWEGSQLFAATGKNNADGTPLIRLEASAGVRGVTVYYPEQTTDSINYIAYPWTIQGLGPNVWARDVTLVNPYQGVDFGTYDTTGHVIDYVAGSPLVTGVFVGNSDEGWMRNVQLIPHYWTRSSYENKPESGPILRGFTQQTLDGIVIGSSRNQHILHTFVYGALRGIRFIEQNGQGGSGVVLGHGSDGCGTALQIDGIDSMDFINTQLVAMETDTKRRNIYVTDGNTGTARFFNSIFWGQPDTNIEINGGTIVLQQAGFSRPAPVELRGGRIDIVGAYFQHDTENIQIRPGVTSANIIGNVRVGRGAESANFVNQAGSSAIFQHNVRMPW